MPPQAELGWEGLAPVPVDPTDTSDTADTLTPGTRSACRDCGKDLTVTAKGELRSHKCVNDLPGKRGTKTGSRKGPPKQTREFAVDMLAAGIEFTASHAVGRYVPCDPNDVPVKLGVVDDVGTFEDKADEMVGPLVDLIWPQLPKGAQKALTAIADEADLIVCVMLWYQYTQGLKEWGQQQKARKLDETRRLRSVPNPTTETPAAATEGGAPLVVHGTPFEPANPTG